MRLWRRIKTEESVAKDRVGDSGGRDLIAIVLMKLNSMVSVYK